MKHLKFFLPILAVFIFLPLFGCSSNPASTEGPVSQEEQELTEIVEQLVQSLRNCDVDALRPLVLTENPDALADSVRGQEQYLRLFFQNLRYTITDISVSGSTATVSCEMSNVDLVRIAPDLLSALGGVDFSGIQSAGDLTDQITGEVAAVLSAVIDREENPRISRAVQLKFVQRDGWKLDTEDEGFTDVFDIMTGGVRALAG